MQNNGVLLVTRYMHMTIVTNRNPPFVNISYCMVVKCIWELNTRNLKYKCLVSSGLKITSVYIGDYGFLLVDPNKVVYRD